MRRWLFRLPRYSGFGWDKISISQEDFLVHETATLSTISVLEVQMGQDPYLPRGVSSFMRRQIINYFGTRSSDGRSSLSPKKIFSSMRRRQIFDYFGTRSSDGTSSLSPKRTFSYKKQQPVDYHSTRLKPRQDLYFTRRIIHPWDDNSSTTTVLDQKETRSQSRNHHTRRSRPVDYYGTRQHKRLLLPKRIHPSTRWSKASTTTVLEQWKDKISIY